MSSIKFNLFARLASPNRATEVGMPDLSENVATADDPTVADATTARASKISQISAAIGSPEGVSLDDLTAISGWQPHTIRAAPSRLRRKGMRIYHATDESGRRVHRLAADEAEA